jgi:regulator of CtrA degradation
MTGTGDGRVAPFDPTYDETMRLLVEARNYAAYREPAECRRLPPGARLQACSESMRVTSRLAEVMAWLLAQKAARAGEITPLEAASARFALSEAEVCMDDGGRGDESLPEGLRSLLDRSRSLYVRVGRLQEQVRGSCDA